MISKWFPIWVILPVFLLSSCTPIEAVGALGGSAMKSDMPARPVQTQPEPAQVGLTVAAAADLQFAFTDLGRMFEEETGEKVTFVFGSTGQLSQQIENGAPYDLFAAANLEYINHLVERDLVLKDSISLYARGRIVLAANRQSGISVISLQDLLDPSVKHVAIANPDHAPYGVAAREALQSARIWKAVQPKLVLAENVRQALQYVQSGDAEAGIVALSVADVPEISWTLIDDSLHQPLDQALAVVTSSDHKQLASQFAAYINSESGRLVMRRYGFTLPGETPLMQPNQTN